MTAPGLGLPKLPPRDAFLHVVYDYRYLALAGWAWNSFGPSGAKVDQDAINKQLPGIGVVIQDSLLLHARNLIEFYSAGGGPTDIRLSDFTTAGPDQGILGSLGPYKPAIEVHLMHLAAWRNETYRLQHAGTAAGIDRQRPSWNADNAKIVTGLMSLLLDISTKAGRWNLAFVELHDAAARVLANGHAQWPKKLTEKPDVLSYLSTLGL